MTVWKRPYNKLIPIPFNNVKITDDFWIKRQKINQEVAIFHQLEMLEKNHHIDNFRIAAGVKKGVTNGMFYLDSDLYKWLEAASYILHINKVPKLEKAVDEIIELINKSQTKDGYVNTYISTKYIEKRYTNLHVFHELYCAGHLIQAAIAHFNATSKRTFLNIAIKFADHLARIFLGGKRKGAPGHEEIEMALIELYRIVGSQNYLDLAEEFIDKRGNIPHFKTYAWNQYINVGKMLKTAKRINEKYEKIHPKRTEELQGAPEYAVKLSVKDLLLLLRQNFNGRAYQMQYPVREAFEPVGHAVRAMYLYCGMADLYSEKGDKGLLKALELVWLKMVKARMYITGGTGSLKAIEGFGKDFQLKPENSYSETCAAIGNMMWNWRMLQITGKAKYADLIERLMYNAMLVGQSFDGKKYTYSNPLISQGKEERQEWFICACCPPNVARTISSLGKYIYSISKKELYIHQYISNNSTIAIEDNEQITIALESNFPWSGEVKITLGLKINKNMSISLRIPTWSKETLLKINGEYYQEDLTPGNYVKIKRNWMNNDTIEMNFRMEPILERADNRSKSTRGKVAIINGPLIYCLEQNDNNLIDIFNFKISENPELKVDFNSELFGGINEIQGKTNLGKSFKAVPYYFWNNRGPNKMLIWLNTQ